MAIKIVFLLLALVGAASAQLRAPTKVNICYPVGNNTHASATVLSTELAKYPGHVKGVCSKICATICQDFTSRKVDAAGQCICIGAPLKCGANAKPSNDKKSCKCLVGFKGDPIKGCADLNECTANKNACGANTDCINTVGSFQCQCKAGFEGSPVTGCTDINECAKSGACSANSKCTNTPGSFTCQYSLAIRACGPTTTDSTGIVWQSEDSLIFGRGRCFHTTNEIAGTTEDWLYQSTREHVDENGFNLAVPNGNYKVVFHFAEIDDRLMYNRARCFGVRVEGNYAYVDTFAAVGGYHAYTKEVTATVTDGEVFIEFLGGCNHSMYSGVTITQVV